MSARWAPRADLVEWLALRRLARGGVAMMRGDFYDDGHLMPCDVADALPSLVDNGRVALAPIDIWGARRASLTSSGEARFGELTAARTDEDPADHAVAAACTPRPAPEPEAPLWALSSFDDRWHALAVRTTRPIARHIARCGLVLDSSVRIELEPGPTCRLCSTLTSAAPGR